MLTEDFPQESLSLLLQSQNICSDFLQRAHGLGLVEAAREADFVPDLCAGRVVPGVRCIGQRLEAQKALDSAVFETRRLLGVAKFAVGFVR